MSFNVYTPEKYESIFVMKKALNFQIIHWISGNTSSALGSLLRSIDRLTDFIVKIRQKVNKINFREFVRHLSYNTNEKRHFVPFKILNVLFWWAQLECDNPHDFYVSTAYQPTNQPTEQELSC